MHATEVPADVIEEPKPKDKPPAKPPKRRRPTSKSKASDADIRSSLDSIFVGLGAVWSTFDPHCGYILTSRGPAVTDALLVAAKENERLHEALSTFVTASTWGQVVTAGMMVAVPIAAHHGVLPAMTLDLVGLTPEEKAALGLEENDATADEDKES